MPPQKLGLFSPVSLYHLRKKKVLKVEFSTLCLVHQFAFVLQKKAPVVEVFLHELVAVGNSDCQDFSHLIFQCRTFFFI